MNGAIGAHFTPSGLARDFAIDAGGGRRVIDLCAGIGRPGLLGPRWPCRGDGLRGGEPGLCRSRTRRSCRRRNGSAATCSRCLILDGSTSPYQTRHSGAVPRAWPGRARRYTGASFEYHVMDMAADMAGRGTLSSFPEQRTLRLSGAPHYTVTRSDAISELYEQTGDVNGRRLRVDTSFYRNDWHDAAPL